jgi:thymidylate synthase (FAD)
MKVELIDHMGNDLDVVNAARVSFDKESEWVYPGGEREWSDWHDLKEQDTKLIHYLVEHDHWSPFSHVIAKFRVTAPIIINHQLWKSHIGAATQDDICGWNGVSRRYVDSLPEFYTPEVWRKRAEDKKQGSSGEVIDSTVKEFFYGQSENASLDDVLSWHYEDCSSLYSQLIQAGAAPEQARIVLPQSMMTEWIWTGSLAFWARLYKLRMHETAQEECKPIAKAIGEHMKTLFPVSWSALVE